MSKSVRLRGFGDQEVTDRLKSRISDGAMDAAWMRITDPMVTPGRILDQVMDHIEQEVEDAPT